MSLSVRKQPIEVSIKNGSFFTGVKHDSFHFLFYFYIWIFFKRMGLFDVSKLRRTLLSHPQDVALVSLATGDFVICFFISPLEVFYTKLCAQLACSS